MRGGQRESGVYLITGGLGGIGYTLAEFLAESARVKLVLLARTALPERGEWEQQPVGENGGEKSSGDEEVARRIARVKRLEELGAEVMVLSADVADEEQLRAAVRLATDRFGKIHGVIHSAGVAGGGVIQFKTAEDIARVFAPKVRGALLLDAVFKDDELDFLVLCSSLKSVLGEFGQSDYCAASIFLDAFAHSLRSTGATNATLINWYGCIKSLVRLPEAKSESRPATVLFSLRGRRENGFSVNGRIVCLPTSRFISFNCPVAGDV